MTLGRIRSLAAIFTLTCISGCVAAAGSPDSYEPAADGVDESSDPVSASLAVGTVLKVTGNLNLRSAASTSASVLEVMPKGDTVTVLKSAPKNGYYNVDHDGASGWASGKYLVEQSSGGGGSGGGTGGSSGEPWSCPGSYATTKVAGGSYYATSFGCWKDANGVAHGDSGDNCIPGCLSKARSAGVCTSSQSGKSCEQSVNWYAADAGRFGCLARLRVENPDNGRCAIVMVLDYGPSCSVEKKVKAGVVDLSGRASDYLFGGGVGWSDKAAVQVTEVPSSTPLGPC